ncbi:MAG: phosphate/phosphite/phosphonate ABC transporter substrate-binding protein [Bdellovibrionia bacterium]
MNTLQPLVVGITAAFVSEAGVPIYNRIAEYLQKQLEQKVDFVTGFSYSTVNEMLGKGIISVAFVCGLPYVMSRETQPPQSQIIAAPVLEAPRYQKKPQYFSDISVHINSPIKSFMDLRDKVFVYNEEISNSGYNMPRYHMLRLGLTHGFFKKVLRSGSHEESIRMVAEGLADASAVDSMVLDYDKAKNPEFASRIKVIESLGPAPIPPVVVSSHLSTSQLELIRKSFIEMHTNPEGQAILNEALLNRFVTVIDQDYQSIQIIRDEALKAGFSKIR